MNAWLLVALALLTYASRAVALVLLPTPSGRVQAVLERVPAPLFAGFAAISMVTAERSLAPPETLAAVAAAVIAGRTRSLLLVLAAGLAGYAAVAGVRLVAS